MKPKYVVFPEDIQYMVKMVPKTIPLREARVGDTIFTPCHLKNTNDGFVTLSAEGFYDANFVDKHFEFLLFSGDVKRVS